MGPHSYGHEGTGQTTAATGDDTKIPNTYSHN